VILTIRQPYILDFDLENRPLSYLGMDFTTSEITAIAAGWAGNEHVEFFGLPAFAGTDEGWRIRTVEMLESFRTLYNRADIVTGHYIRKHDLPIINGALVEMGRPPLAPKMTVDTKLDLIRFSGISKSQESLGLMLAHFNSAEYLASKEHMGQDDWRRANRLSVEGVEETKRRVVGDVHQHKAMRLALHQAGLLRSPKQWRP
jgi:hypothetical protein